MFCGASARLFEQARQLRQSMTPAECALWERLRANRLDGYRFKAQHPIGQFVADFYVHVARLVIELDGGVHDSVAQQEYDANRTYLLDEFGLTVIRFRNEEVFNDMENVLQRIREAIRAAVSPPEG